MVCRQCRKTFLLLYCFFFSLFLSTLFLPHYLRSAISLLFVSDISHILSVNGYLLVEQLYKFLGAGVKGKREVPRGVRNSKVRRQDKFRRDWSRHKNTCKSQSGTGPGVRRSKRPLLACRTRCICSMETLYN